MNTESFDPYHRWLSIPPREQPPDHYRLLGVQRFESDPNVIENAADKQMAHLRSVQSGKHGPLSQQLLNEVAAAHVCLLNADRKAAYDTKLREQLAAETVSGSPGEPVFPLPREPEAFPVLEAADTANVRVRRGRPSPVLLAASALAAIALLGTLAWHITGLEHDNAETPPVAPRKAERPVAARRLEEPARPPGRASAPERHQFADGNEPNPASTIAVELPGPPESQHTPTAPSLAVVPFNAAQARQHQEAWASHLGVPVEWTNSIGMKFVLIPPGEFHMGSPENEGERSTEKTRSDGALHANNGRNRSETPQHRVRITQAFFLGICEVSQAEYKSVMGRNPSSFSAEGKDAGKVASLDTDGHPVDSITCAEASAFCETLSARPQEKAAGRVYTLPAEAQWEYACRAGTATEWSCDDDGRVLGQYAWFDGNSGRTTHEVGKRLPNGFGLFDVHGNVWEWCADRFDEGYYAISPVDDPPGPESGSVGVIRGGSWGHDAKRCRSATRHPYGLTLRFHTVGVRVACVPGGMRGQSDVVAVAPPTAHDDGPTVLTPPEEPPAEGPQAPETAKAKRKPVPAVSAQQEIRRKIDDLCGTVTLHKPDEALALANKLAALAEKAGDAAERFVLLRRASELASDANNLQRMLELLNRIVEEFEVDRVTVQCAMLTAFAKRATGETQIGALVDASAGPLDETLAAERFDLADALSASVYRACQASAGREFRVDALARRREVQELRKRWEEVQAALAALTSSPDDEAAHSVVGAWCWFVRNDWDRALPHLAKGSDPALRKLADRELNSPPENPVAQVELADAWWELAAAGEDKSKAVLLQRATFWYEQAKPHVDKPLLAAKVAKRLAESVSYHETLQPRARATEPMPSRGQRTATRQPPDIGIKEPDHVPVGKVQEYPFGKAIKQLATTADGRTLAAVGWEGGLTCWNTGSGEVVVRMPLPQTLYGVALSPDGRFAVCGGRSPVLHVLDLVTKEEIKTIPIVDWQFTQVLSRDGKHLLVGTGKGARLWNIESGTETVRLQGTQGWVESVCFSGDEQLVGTAGTDKTARVLHVPTGREVARFTGHTSHVRSVAISRDSRLALSGGDDKMARLWDVATGREIRRVEHRGNVWGVAFTENGRYAISAGSDVRVWDVTDGRQVILFDEAGNCEHVLLLPDNRFLLTSGGQTAILWRLPFTADGRASEELERKSP